MSEQQGQTTIDDLRRTMGDINASQLRAIAIVQQNEMVSSTESLKILDHLEKALVELQSAQLEKEILQADNDRLYALLLKNGISTDSKQEGDGATET